MTDRKTLPVRRWAHSALAALGILFAGAIVLLWSWNGFAVDILQAPELRFSHALALELLLLSAAAAPVLAVRMLDLRRRGSAPS